MLPDFALDPVPLDELLRLRAAEDPQAPLMVTAEQAGIVTVGDMYRMAGGAAAYLTARGIGPGDRVAVWGQNSVSWAVWLCAAGWCGASVVSLHPMLSGNDLALALAQSRPGWLIADQQARGRFLGTIASEVMASRPVSGLRGLTVVPGNDGLLAFADILDQRAAPPAHLGRLGAPLNLQFTSGTTDTPKIVVLSHRALVINAVNTARAAGIGAEDRLASPMPFVHAAGLSSGFILALAVKALWCTSHRFRADTLLSQIQQYRCTVLQGVPTMFKGLLDLMDAEDAETPSLRLGFIGGAPCPEDLCRRSIARLGLGHMAVVYGQTEFGPTISLTGGAEPPSLALASVGKPLPAVELRVVEPLTGVTLPDGAEGEIWVRGPTLMDGYFENQAATLAAVTPDGWLKTGDLGVLTESCLKVTARLKELIIRGGENISPYEVEDALRGAPGVADLAAVPLPSAHWGEEICLVLLASAEGSPDIQALRALAERRLTRYKRPDQYVVLDEFPSLPSGKVDRVAIRRAVAAKEWT